MVVHNHDGIPAPETYYTLEEAAVFSRRTAVAMRQLRTKGKGPRFRKVDGRLLVSATDLQNWLSGEDTPVPPQKAATARNTAAVAHKTRPRPPRSKSTHNHQP